MKEVDGVGLQNLAVMHQPPHLLRRGRQPVHASDDVHGLSGAKMMADRTNAAETLDDDGNLPIHASLDEALETPEFHDVETRLLDLAGLVEPDGDLAVTFDAGDRIDYDLARTLNDLDVAHRLCLFMMPLIRTYTAHTAAPAPYR